MFREPVRAIDLGVYLDQAAYPPWGFRARHIDHAQGARVMAGSLNMGTFRPQDDETVDYPEALGLAWTHVQMSDHTGNHIDAPFHFGPTVAGKPAKTIDEVPLSWCFGPGVRIDVRRFAGRDIEPDDIEAELKRTGSTISSGTIPLLWTGADQAIDDDRGYWPAQAGLSPAGLHYFLERGVKLVGIDGYAMDVSFQTMKRDRDKGSPNPLPLHYLGRSHEHMHLEKLANLDALPRADGFLFTAFPIKLRGGSAGWVRPVAFVPESHFDHRGDEG